jgi:uncharacterized protein (DUF433 family)
MKFDRITFNPNVMGGKPCIRGMRVTVGAILGLLAAKRTREEILEAYPYLEDADISAALEFVAKNVI